MIEFILPGGNKAETDKIREKFGQQNAKTRKEKSTIRSDQPGSKLGANCPSKKPIL